MQCKIAIVVLASVLLVSAGCADKRDCTITLYPNFAPPEVIQTTWLVRPARDTIIYIDKSTGERVTFTGSYKYACK